MFCEICPHEDSPERSEVEKFAFEDKDFFKGFFFGVMYGMVLSAVILLR